MALFGCTRLASRSLLLQSSKLRGSAMGFAGAKTGEIPEFVRGISHLLQSNYNGLYNFEKCQSYLQAIFLSTGRAFHATAPLGAIEKDYYKILGVPRDASQDDIKKAFLTLAKKYHPDTNSSQSGKSKFQEIRDAYEILRDPSNRAQYDKRFTGEEEMRYTADDAREFHNRTYQDPFTGSQKAGRDRFSDQFYKIFAEVFDDERGTYAEDVEVVVKLPFAAAVKGAKVELSYAAKVLCDSCDGRGYSVNAKRYVCPNCDGLGKVTIFPFRTTCDLCRGSGRIIKDFCLVCKGVGVIDGMRTVNVEIPAGVDSGDRIRVAEAGNSGRQGVNLGNLILKLEVEKDPVFVRDGSDIYVDARISFTQAILGGTVEVPTLSGKTQLRIPKGVQPGHRVILRGKGLPRGPSEARYLDCGDQYVHFRVYFPSSVNERQRAILEEFALEEATKENNEFFEDNWWQQLVSHLTDPKVVMLGIAIIVLLNLVLGKTTS
ncbi:hypothetical protein LUZ61_003894 [Rhynchospora tenuis]|uniref:Chaperone protein dnaJ 1, mitochondrial n=1 Tax=Rhynchospora tenuis TaxID=198213 RepID=A0AAD5ZLQ7_9POAL|nr:hypothetical protein LUZ61_003894 [Rhynchospora tenuis]